MPQGDIVLFCNTACNIDNDRLREAFLFHHLNCFVFVYASRLYVEHYDPGCRISFRKRQQIFHRGQDQHVLTRRYPVGRTHSCRLEIACYRIDHIAGVGDDGNRSGRKGLSRRVAPHSSHANLIVGIDHPQGIASNNIDTGPLCNAAGLGCHLDGYVLGNDKDGLHTILSMVHHLFYLAVYCRRRRIDDDLVGKIFSRGHTHEFFKGGIDRYEATGGLNGVTAFAQSPAADDICTVFLGFFRDLGCLSARDIGNRNAITLFQKIGKCLRPHNTTSLLFDTASASLAAYSATRVTGVSGPKIT